MKTVFLFSLIIGSIAMAATEPLLTPVRPSSEIETSCRAKAKEIAADTYRSCVTDQKNAQIEQIKKDYAAKLQTLKAQYEAELKKMNATKTKASAEEIEGAVIKPETKKAPAPAPAPAPKKVSAAKVPKKVSKKSSVVADEMTVQLKPAPKTPSTDESTMDLPEPIPVEEISSESAI